MKLRQKFLRAGSLTVLTLSSVIGGCAAPGKSWYKTATEESLIYWSTGDYEQAVVSAQKALQSNPKDPYALMVAGLSYDSLGYPNQSRRYYEDVLLMDTPAVGVFSAVKNMPAEEVKKGALERLNMMELKKRPFAQVNPETQVATFTQEAFPKQDGQTVTQKAQTAAPKTEIKGGLDMLSEGDRNVVLRFITFQRLRNEKYVTEEEWETRRAVNLGGLLPYTLTPPGLGLDLPSPEADVIIGRLNALRTALEMRAISPREHAAEREIILEALLPSNPFYRMIPMAPPQDILDGATALRRLEMLKGLGLITAAEAKKESDAVEKLTYAKIGMAGNGKGRPAAAQCIQKCLSAPASPCPAVAPKPAASKAKPKKKVVAPAPKPAAEAQTCPCP